LPFKEGTLEKLMKKFSGDAEDEVLEKAMGDTYRYYQQLEKLKRMHSYQARLPYELQLN
jgi:hypothetical protein